MKALVDWIRRALEDGENPSSSRLIAVPVLFCIFFVPLTVWVFVSVKQGVLAEIPGTVVAFVGTVSSPLLAFLHMNKRVEENV